MKDVKLITLLNILAIDYRKARRMGDVAKALHHDVNVCYYQGQMRAIQRSFKYMHGMNMGRGSR